MVYKLITDCPVCSSKLRAVKLSCPVCSTTVENEFEFSRFETLSQEQLKFVEVFLRSRGSIKEVEKELGVSYPTVKGKLNDVLRALGYDVADIPDEKETTDIKSILDRIESGEIAPEEAVEKIKKSK